MYLAAAVVLVFVLWLIDKHDEWRRAVKLCVIPLFLIAAGLIWNEYPVWHRKWNFIVLQHRFKTGNPWQVEKVAERAFLNGEISDAQFDLLIQQNPAALSSSPREDVTACIARFDSEREPVRELDARGLANQIRAKYNAYWGESDDAIVRSFAEKFPEIIRFLTKGERERLALTNVVAERCEDNPSAQPQGDSPAFGAVPH